jgi:hypothetical protein
MVFITDGSGLGQRDLAADADRGGHLEQTRVAGQE